MPSLVACDMSLLAYHQAYAFPVVFTRVANVFGPGQQLYRIIPRTILTIRAGGKLLHGGGYSERSFIHVDDVIRGTLEIAARGVPVGLSFGNRFNDLNPQLVQRICDLMEVDFDSVIEETGERLGKDKLYRLDCRRIHREISWEAERDLESGLRETINWVDKYFNELTNMPWEYQHKL